MDGTELKPSNQTLLLNQCQCGINPQHTAIKQKPNSQMFTIQALEHTTS
jgi:hypothetical protein